MAKEQKNSPNDMDTITMWATVSSLGADARYKRPLHITSQPVYVANGTDVPEVANTRTVIQSFDGAKVQKNSETAKEYIYKIVYTYLLTIQKIELLDAPMALYLFDITDSTNFKLWFVNHVHQQISAIHFCIWAVIQSVMSQAPQFFLCL